MREFLRLLEALVHLVDFVHREDTGLFVKERTKQWTLREERQRVRFAANRFPALASNVPDCLKKKFLQRFVEFADHFLFIDPDITMKSFDHGASGFRDGTGKLGLSGTWRPLHKQRPTQLHCEVDHGKQFIDDEVLN